MALPYEDRMLLGDVLVGINLDQATITEIMTMLEQEAETVHDGVPVSVDGQWFGGSPTGAHRLAVNTGMAHDAMREEMAKLVAGLRGYKDNIRRHAEDMDLTDQDTAAVMTGIESSASCVVAPTFQSQCSLPTPELPEETR